MISPAGWQADLTHSRLSIQHIDQLIFNLSPVAANLAQMRGNTIF
ncbi:MAG TPA: hypothetical protein VJ915_11740 [Balneolaceae bacterium]|nr:hypothetical protein [Balneolaceae bacterium]